MIVHAKMLTEFGDATERPSPGAELFEITFDCGHTIRSWRSGGCPIAGDREACPKCKDNANLITLGHPVHLYDHRGGDIIFQPGKGWKPAEHPDPPVDGDIIFKQADESDFLVLKANGDAFVKGEKVQSRQEVYDYFAAWLVEANIMPRKGG